MSETEFFARNEDRATSAMKKAGYKSHTARIPQIKINPRLVRNE